ncbi:hypothetical protein ES703_94593 [subsurface metagenome]
MNSFELGIKFQYLKRVYHIYFFIIYLINSLKIIKFYYDFPAHKFLKIIIKFNYNIFIVKFRFKAFERKSQIINKNVLFKYLKFEKYSINGYKIHF